MPQNPTQVLVGLNGGQPTALATTAGREAVVSPVPSQQALSIASATGTIASTGTFQACMAANADRAGAVIANNGTKAMAVSFTAAGSADADKSLPLAIGATLSLASITGPNANYTGPISITGTAADKFATVEFTKA